MDEERDKDGSTDALCQRDQLGVLLARQSQRSCTGAVKVGRMRRSGMRTWIAVGQR